MNEVFEMNEAYGLFTSKACSCFTPNQKQSEDIYLMLCGLERCRPGYRFDTAQRPGYHLHVILSGKGMLCVEGRKKELHFGQLFLTKPDEETWYQADLEEPWVYCWMTFDGNNARTYVERAGFQEHINWLNCFVAQERFYSVVQKVLSLPEMTLANDLARLGALLEFISLAVESNYKSEQTTRHSREYASDDYVEYALGYIRYNYATATISDVAKNIGIHRSYLTNIFRKKVGISPQEHLMQCRMRESSRLLLETCMPVQEIAKQVGYENPMTFSKIFKNEYGLSPKHYRLQNLKENKP